MMKDLGARAFNYGYASPVLMVATYNDDGSVNVMNLHECTRTNAGHLALCISQLQLHRGPCGKPESRRIGAGRQ